MADISKELASIMAARYGKDVRGSIYNAIKTINDVSEVVLSAGTAITSSSSSTTGYYDKSIYFNEETYDLWQCNLIQSRWDLLANLKGEKGEKGDNGENQYLHIKYSENPDGTDFHDIPTVNDNYIGHYTGNSETAPVNKEDYTWMYVGFDPVRSSVEIDFETGDLLYSGGNLAFRINETTGNLEWGED